MSEKKTPKRSIEKYFDSPQDKPDHLVKYYSLKEYNIDAIEKGYLYFSHPMNQNDPFDSCIQFIDLSKLSLEQFINFYKTHRKLICPDKELGDNEIIQYVSYYFKKDITSFSNDTKTLYWNFVFKDYGLLSLTSKVDNLLMWSYYGNNESFAIQFKDIRFNNNTVYGPFQMEYLNNYDTIYIKHHDIDLNSLFQIIKIKSNQWIHEDEWRYLLFNPNMSIPIYQDITLDEQKRKVKYNPENIECIILGFKFFKEAITKETIQFKNKFVYHFQNHDNIETYFKIRLLNFIISNDLKVKQISTTDDNTFRIKTDHIQISCIQKDEKYSINIIS